MQVKELVQQLLDRGPPGAFLVRDPESRADSYALVVRLQTPETRNFLIACEPDAFVFGALRRTRLCDLIAALERPNAALPVPLALDFALRRRSRSTNPASSPPPAAPQPRRKAPPPPASGATPPPTRVGNGSAPASVAAAAGVITRLPMAAATAPSGPLASKTTRAPPARAAADTDVSQLPDLTDGVAMPVSVPSEPHPRDSAAAWNDLSFLLAVDDLSITQGPEGHASLSPRPGTGSAQPSALRSDRKSEAQHAQPAAAPASGQPTARAVVLPRTRREIARALGIHEGELAVVQPLQRHLYVIAAVDSSDGPVPEGTEVDIIEDLPSGAVVCRTADGRVFAAPRAAVASEDDICMESLGAAARGGAATSGGPADDWSDYETTPVGLRVRAVGVGGGG